MSDSRFKPLGGGMTRRKFLGRAASTGALGIAGGSLPLGARPAAASDTVIRVYGPGPAGLLDWSGLTAETGLTVTMTPTAGDIGIFMRDVMVNDAGASHDVFFFDGGAEDILGPEGFFAEIDEDHPSLVNWARTPDSWKRSNLMQSNDGRQYGVPMIGNADSFAYFPSVLGANPDGQDEISWLTFFEGEEVRGRISFDRSRLQSMPAVANFLKHHGRVEIADPTDLTPTEARAVADYLIERKRAGQFRTLHGSFEEMVQLLTSREVDMINCWESAMHAANATIEGEKAVYAETVEGYYKWAVGAFIPAAAVTRGNIDNIYTFLNYLLGGEYRALQARDRGYTGPNMDLGIAYAEASGWTAEQIAYLTETDEKVTRKYEKPFFSKALPENADVMEEQWQRFLSA